MIKITRARSNRRLIQMERAKRRSRNLLKMRRSLSKKVRTSKRMKRRKVERRKKKKRKKRREIMIRMRENESSLKL